VLQAHGFNARRTPNSGGLSWRGDIAGVPGYVIEVKRTERITVPQWLNQAYAAARGGEVPVVVFRRSRAGTDADGHWHAILSLTALCELLAAANEWERYCLAEFAPASSVPASASSVASTRLYERDPLWYAAPASSVPASSVPGQGQSPVLGSTASTPASSVPGRGPGRVLGSTAADAAARSRAGHG
jgi:hypothetical protein